MAGKARGPKKDSGSKATTDSNVFGTLQSFNAGSKEDGSSGKSFHDANTDKTISPNNPPPRDEDGSSGRSKGKNAGTKESFNVVDKGSGIDMQNANINSGYCSGENNFYDGKFLKAGECTGTKESFNAMSGYKIYLQSARINSGGYAGNSK